MATHHNRASLITFTAIANPRRKGRCNRNGEPGQSIGCAGHCRKRGAADVDPSVRYRTHSFAREPLRSVGNGSNRASNRRPTHIRLDPGGASWQPKRRINSQTPRPGHMQARQARRLVRGVDRQIALASSSSVVRTSSLGAVHVKTFHFSPMKMANAAAMDVPIAIATSCRPESIG
jgi:hypothetical protein